MNTSEVPMDSQGKIVYRSSPVLSHHSPQQNGGDYGPQHRSPLQNGGDYGRQHGRPPQPPPSPVVRPMGSPDQQLASPPALSETAPLLQRTNSPSLQRTLPSYPPAYSYSPGALHQSSPYIPANTGATSPYAQPPHGGGVPYSPMGSGLQRSPSWNVYPRGLPPSPHAPPIRMPGETAHMVPEPSRSPSRRMRVSYADPWSAASPQMSSAHSPQMTSTIISSTTPANGGSYSHRHQQSELSRCFNVIFPDCKFLSVVTLFSFAEIAIYFVLHQMEKHNPAKSFHWFLERGGSFGLLVVRGEVYRIFTSLFLHCQFLQLVFNLLMQQQSGNKMARRFGGGAWLQVWLFSGLVGNLFGAAVQPAKLFVAASAPNLGTTGFNIAEILLISPQLQTSELRTRACVSLFIAASQFFLLSYFWWHQTSLYAHAASFLVGTAAGIVFHRKSASLPSWYNIARAAAVVAVVGIVSFSIVQLGRLETCCTIRPPLIRTT